MNLTDLKTIQKIDATIADLHSELTRLYQARAELVGTPPAVDPSSRDTDSATPSSSRKSAGRKHGSQTQRPAEAIVEEVARAGVRNTYATLASAWKRYNISLPAYEQLEVRLVKAELLRRDLVAARPELKSDLCCLVVPPTQQVLKAFQAYNEAAEYVPLPKDIKIKSSKKWRVFLTQGGTKGSYLGTVKDIIDQKLYRIDGHDMRALGTSEYLALALQSSRPIDTSTATVFLDGSKHVPLSVNYSSLYGYTFEQNEFTGLFGDDRVRLTAEVTD